MWITRWNYFKPPEKEPSCSLLPAARVSTCRHIMWPSVGNLAAAHRPKRKYWSVQLLVSIAVDRSQSVCICAVSHTTNHLISNLHATIGSHLHKLVWFLVSCSFAKEARLLTCGNANAIHFFKLCNHLSNGRSARIMPSHYVAVCRQRDTRLECNPCIVMVAMASGWVWF